jgi:8-oxo-dGTP pyrophosphatase MutT (NUDIX family)
MPVDQAILDFMARHWQEALTYARLRNQVLFSTDLLRLHGWTSGQMQLLLHTGTTNYQEYVCTNRAQAGLEDAAGHAIRSSSLANPLAICVCLRSSDGYLLIAQRSQATYDHPGYYHVPGGHIEIARHVLSGRVDVKRALLDELSEEFGISARDIGNISCTGLVCDHASHKPELTLTAHYRKNRHTIRGPRNEEHGHLRWLRDDCRALANFVRRANRQLVPSGKACLMLYGRVRYGWQWLQQLNAALSILPIA